MMVRKFRFLIVACALLLAQSSAQYYEQREYAPSESRYVALGALDRDFTPLGSNSLPDSLAIRYKRVMPVISFHQGSAELFFGYATYSLSGNSKSAIFFGARYGAEVPIVGRFPSVLLFPLQLAADFTKAEGFGARRDDFNIASVGIGTGLKYRYLGRNAEFSIGAQECVHYSVEGIGTGNGWSAATLGDVVLLLKDVAVLDGVAIGYRFRLQTWSMNQTKRNYRSVSHGPCLGIVF
jgi:hypothetical protein